ncbi:MAG: HPr family phosphocarrier protein [Eubacterium sp.]|nr:HPr family phosphocarrier protein [Eubacterium sp.]
MTTKKIVVKLPSYAEARPVAEIVQTASRFDSEIYLISGNKKINAKSIMGMMSLGLYNEEEIEVEATGNDEQDAVNAITNYIGSVA